jgi:hypothetical protein
MRLSLRQAAAALLWCSVGAFACGSRTGLRGAGSDAGTGAEPDAAGLDAGIDAPLPECVQATDCAIEPGQCARAECLEGTCVIEVRRDCDDGDECTIDTCDPLTLACSHAPITVDADGDGYKAPRPGFLAGSPGSCGDDCDDRDPAIRPGALEICDGLDNDCNSNIDDGLGYAPAGSGLVRVSAQDFERASRAGFAHNGRNYGLTLTGKKRTWNGYFKAVDRFGREELAEQPVVNVNAASYAGGLAWTGAIFATAWEDARQDTNYEIYFNLLDPDGNKLMADLRLSNADDFSLHPRVLYNRSEFVVIWDDRRFASDPRLFGQRVGTAGDLIGGNVQLTPEMTRAEFAAAAVGQRRIGLAFTALEADDRVRAKFRTLGLDLGALGPITDLSGVDANDPNVVYAGGRFVITWDQKDRATIPGPSIYGAVFAEEGGLLVPERAVTEPAPFARSHATLSLGDRIVLVWSEYALGVYDLYFKVLDPSLNDLSPRTRITSTLSDSLGPALAVGPEGDIGILFDDWQTGAPQVYFTRLVCGALSD